jgi:hypothetical protein
LLLLLSDVCCAPWGVLPELVSAWQVLQVVSSGRNASYLMQEQHQDVPTQHTP